MEKKIVLSFPLNTSEQQALESFESMRPEAKGYVKKYFFIEDDTVFSRGLQKSLYVRQRQQAYDEHA